LKLNAIDIKTLPIHQFNDSIAKFLMKKNLTYLILT
jgi:hypothetical protein